MNLCQLVHLFESEVIGQSNNIPANIELHILINYLIMRLFNLYLKKKI